MSRKSLFGAMGAALVAAVVTTIGAADVSAGTVDLIQNGSFETTSYVFSGDWYNTNPPVGESSILPNWYLTQSSRNGAPDFRWYFQEGGAVSNWPATPYGDRYLNFCLWVNENPPETAGQNIAVVAGTEYTVRFAEMYRASGAKMRASLTFAAGTATGTKELITNSDSTWTEYSFKFVPDTSTTATLKFNATNWASGRDNGAYLDSVSVTYHVADLLSGDANGDGTVDGTDLNTVLSNYNSIGMTWAQGDFNADGTVDGADLNTVLSNYNQISGVGAAVPEPSTLLLAAAGLLGLLVYAWRKRM
jgi:hypothetical protein